METLSYFNSFWCALACLYVIAMERSSDADQGMRALPSHRDDLKIEGTVYCKLV
jgi:hypothetical protein